MRILSPLGFTAPPAQPARLERAHLLNALPTRAGGAGMTPAVITQPCAFLAAVQTALYHPALFNARHTLKPDIEASLDALADNLGEADQQTSLTIAAVIPTTASGFLDVDSSSSHQLPPHWRRVQSVLVGTVAAAERNRLLAACNPRTQTPTPAMTKVDMQHVTLIILRAQLSRIMQAPLHHRDNWIEALDLIFFWRYYLGLPRLLRPGRATAALPPPSPPVSDTDVAQRALDPNWTPVTAEVCSLAHPNRGLLAPTADHAISCPSTFRERYRTHNDICRVVRRAALDAGCTAETEPPTAALLLHEFSAYEVRTLCPKTQSKANMARSAAIYTALTKLAALPKGSPGIQTALLAIKKIINDTPVSTKGVRLDLALKMPNGHDLWIDFAGVHPTTRSAMGRIDNWLTTINMGDFVSSGATATNPSARAPSPAVALTVQGKEKRYELLMQLAQHQAHAGRRACTPLLCAAVVTHLGELSPGFIQLIEKITTAAGAGYQPGPLNCGAPRKMFTNRFRTRLKDGIMAANARGFGRALRGAGNPMPGWICSHVDELLLPTWDDPSY